jgi:hypothetical protein
MFNPNNINNSANEHEENTEAETLKNDSLNKKLGDIANTRVLNEKLLHEEAEGNLLRADDEISYTLNLKSLGDYLTKVNINPESAEPLLASGVFDVFSHPTAYRLSLRNQESEAGEPYLTSATRDEFGQSRQSNHTYKVFERNGLFVVYDSAVGTREKHYIMDDPLSDGPSKYTNNFDQVTFVDPDTSKIVALGRYASEELAHGPAEGSVINVNDKNIDEDLKKFSFKIIDQEKFAKPNEQQ